jgi:hypothetical protein
MKTFLVVVITIAATWIVASHVHEVQSNRERGREHGWFIGRVKAPVRLALQDIRLDINDGKFQLAKAKLDIFIDTWQRVNWLGHGIGADEILRAFDNADTNSIIAHPEPSGANGSHQ